VLDLLGDVAGHRILDAGCGSGPLVADLEERGASVAGFDASPAMIYLARERLGDEADLRVADLTLQLPYIPACPFTHLPMSGRRCHAAAMGADPGEKPLLRGRGVLLIEDFCRASGLGLDTVQSLMRSGRLEGGLWRDQERTRPFGIFDDVLPSRSALTAMGLPVRDDYEPETLRSYEMAGEDDPQAG